MAGITPEEFFRAAGVTLGRTPNCRSSFALRYFSRRCDLFSLVAGGGARALPSPLNLTRMDRLGARAAAADGDVVRAVLAGDAERYAELVRRYRDRYARYAARMLGSADAAEDAVQDAFIRAYDQLAQCRDPENFAGWFFLILRNRCFAERRRSKREAVADVSQDDLPGPGRADRDAEQTETQELLARGVSELTAEQREVFVLKHVEGKSYDEIAAATGATVASLKMRMHRAYDRLRTYLKERT